MKQGTIILILVVIVIAGLGVLLWQLGYFGGKGPEAGETIPVKPPQQEPIPITTTQPAPVSFPETQGEYYTVQSGDKLWSIAKKFYGAGEKYKLIVDANPGKIPADVTKLQIGTILLIPKDEISTLPSQPQPVEPTQPKTRYHTVVKGDNLQKIALKYYKDASKDQLIFEANKDKLSTKSTTLKIDWKLVIPEISSEIVPKESTPTPSGSPE